MKKLLLLVGVALFATGSLAGAQEVRSELADYIPDISLDMRGSYRIDSEYKSGRFTGDDLYLDINGYISPNFSYSFNHRIASTYYGKASGFDATNWLTLTYETDNFAITAGKDALLMGSFEYDAYDLDAYFEMNSPFYNDFDCWQWGASAAWYPADDHELIFQVAKSPVAAESMEQVSLALAWRGAWDCYESYWTANMWQYDAKAFTKAFNSGNRFTFGGLVIDLDLMFRFNHPEEENWGFTGIFAPSYTFGEWGRIFTKAGWDKETDNCFFGGGFEYFPLKDNKDIRFHIAYTHNDDDEIGNMVSLGLTWKMNLTGNIKKLFGATED